MHGQGCLGIFQKEPGAGVLWVCCQHPFVAIGGLVVPVSILVEYTEVHDGVDVCGIGLAQPRLEFDGDVILTGDVVLIGKVDE